MHTYVHAYIHVYTCHLAFVMVPDFCGPSALVYADIEAFVDLLFVNLLFFITSRHHEVIVARRKEGFLQVSQRVINLSGPSRY